MKDAMVDLETLGNGSNSVIIAIGAVKFDPRTGRVGELADRFYTNVDPQSCVEAGLQMDVSTVMWWMSQSDAARAAVTKPGRQLAEALAEFSKWLPADACVWGNGATFDNVILANAYRALRLPQPWKHWNDRCYRTLKNLHPDIKAPARQGVAHNALDDAVFQAEHACAILRK